MIARHHSEQGRKLAPALLSPPIIVVAKDQCVQSMTRNDLLLSELDKSYTLCALEREMYEGQELHDLCPIQLVITQPRRSYFLWSQQKPITMSRIILCNTEMNER